MIEVKKKSSTGGVFWLIENEILAIPYVEGAEVGIAKSGKNYNHRLLWSYVKPKRCNKKFDYYPRGRVEIDSRDRAVIFMSPHIDLSYIPEIKNVFGITEIRKIHYDGSEHYKCHFDYEFNI